MMKYFIEQLEEAEKFLSELEESKKVKFAKVFRKVQEGHNSVEDFKKLPGTKGLFEFRVKDKGIWLRALCFVTLYAGDDRATIVITHGFVKKTNKTPSSEIQKAQRIKKSFLNS